MTPLDVLRQTIAEAQGQDDEGWWRDEWDALADVQALVDAARPLGAYDFAATEWVVAPGDLRVVDANAIGNLEAEIAALRAARLHAWWLNRSAS